MQRVEDIRIKQLNPAAANGDLDLIKKIIQDHKERKLRPNDITVRNAIISGNINLLKYLEETFAITPSHLSPGLLNDAIANMKSTEMFKHLLSNYRGIRFGLDTKTTEIVARSGNVDNLKLLLSVRIPYATSDTLYGAVMSRSMDCIRFLVEDYKIDGKAVITDYDESIAKAENMQLSEIAAYLREKQAPINQTTFKL